MWEGGGRGAGNLSACKELTAAGAVIEGDFPRGQRLGQLGQSTAKLYTANVQGIYTASCKFDITLWAASSLHCHRVTKKEGYVLFGCVLSMV
jgi:hypothetical protein